jgi:hypothetical protein
VRVSFFILKGTDRMNRSSRVLCIFSCFSYVGSRVCLKYSVIHLLLPNSLLFAESFQCDFGQVDAVELLSTLRRFAVNDSISGQLSGRIRVGKEGAWNPWKREAEMTREIESE